jgi:DNA-binding MarR family transcriptional regulator
VSSETGQASSRPNGKRQSAKRDSEQQGPDVELGPLDGYIGFHLRRAQETALRAFVATASQPAFKPGRFAALMVIRLNPGLSQIDVCRAIGRDKSTMSPLIRELAHDGLIVRESSERDRRSVTLRLTAKGEATLDRLLTSVQVHDRRLDAIVGDAKPTLIALLKKIAAALG